MNRYLIAALYVMAGCVVTVPLKVQGNPEPLRGERCRLIVTTTVKTVSEYVGDQEADIAVHKTIFLSDYGKAEQIETPAYTSHKIRAPGL